MLSPSWWYLPRPNLTAKILQPLAFVYQKAAALHAKSRARNPYYAGVPVISIGNLTVGGTGKTPLTIWLAKHFSQNGEHVAIVSRGYGGNLTDQPLRVDATTHTAAQVGDEPLEMAQVFTNQPVSIWVAKNRPAAVRRAEQAGATLILLDDGYQRQDIARQINILVIDGRTGFGNGLCLPAGPLREPVAEIRRASFAVIINEPLDKQNTFYGLNAYRLHLTPTPESLKNLSGPLVAFTGIGHPEKFFKTLFEQKLNVLETHAYPDHFSYPQATLKFLATRAKKRNATLVTTAKDATKIPENFAKILKTSLTGEDAENLREELSLRLR